MTKAAVPKTWSLVVDPDGIRRSKPPADTLPPTTPVIVASAVLSTTSCSITINPSTDSQSGVKEYVFDYRVIGAPTYIEHGRLGHTGSPVTRIYDSLTPGTSYQFVASAIDNSANLNRSPNSLPAVLTTTAGPPVTAFAPAFPRLGRYNIGNPQTYLASWAPTYGKFDVHIINGDYAGWSVGRGYTREASVAAYKAASVRSNGTLVFQYANFNEQLPPGGLGATSGPAHAQYFDQINATNAWLYKVGSSGAKTPSNFNSAYQLINYYADVNIYPWVADYWVRLYREGSIEAGNSAPSLDGIFLDNCLIDPQVSGDWDRDNTTDTSPQMRTRSWLPTGQKRFFDTLKARAPAGKLLGGNTADYGYYLSAQGPMSGVLHLGLFESAMGMTYSYYTWGSAAKMMGIYRALIDFLQAPKILIFGIRTVSPTDYEWVRHGICACLMDDGYACVQPTAKIGTATAYSSDPADWPNYDEYWGGTLNAHHYLGAPVDPRQTGPLYNIEAGGTGGGTWRRRYTNGEVWWNARRGSGPITSFDQTTPYPSHAIGRTVRAFTGVLDTTVNNGATGITTFPSLPPNRGRIYLY